MARLYRGKIGKKVTFAVFSAILVTTCHSRQVTTVKLHLSKVRGCKSTFAKVCVEKYVWKKYIWKKYLGEKVHLEKVHVKIRIISVRFESVYFQLPVAIG